MNEPQLSLRQTRILAILFKQNLTRVRIGDQLKTYYDVSKPTLIRDLNQLIKSGYLGTQGEGKSLTYFLVKKHQLLAYINLEDYFADNSLLRPTAKKSFDFDVFVQLKNIITSQDNKWLNKTQKSLKAQEAKLDPTIFKREIERFTVEFSWKSSKIEGNTYTLLETEILIKQRQEAVGHSREEALMILNHKRAVDYILANRKDYKIINLIKINKLHQLLTWDLGISSGLRQQPVAISGTVYKPLEKIDQIRKAVNQLVKLINQADNPYKKSLLVLAMMAYIQPFADGNKRTSRVLSNAILLAYDLYPLSYRDLNELEYVKAMIIFYEQNNLYHLKRIFLEQTEFAVKTYFQT